MDTTKLIPSFFLFALAITAGAQQPLALPLTKKAAARTTQGEGSGTALLPVARVALYKNGVGFFEHAGRVIGSQSVTIDFTTSQLNDVLQSLTAVDLDGGRIAGAGYNSTTPLEQQLQGLPLALGQSASPMDLYSAIRGARVEVTSPSGTVAGRLFNIEVKTDPTKDGPVERRVLTVVGDDGGVRTAELGPVTEVRLVDAGLHQDLTRYLELLANNRNQGLRHLTLQDNGTGSRALRVSYISEVPIWKSTYRILFTEPKDANTKAQQTATLQGWSVVDNTTGADWVNVQLSLVAGAPQSFIQPLSVPLYSRRLQIGIQQEAQTAPQIHQSGEMRGMGSEGAIVGTVMDRTGAVIAGARVVATSTNTGVQVSRISNGSGGYSISPLTPGTYNVEVSAPGFQRMLQENLQVNGVQRAGFNPKLSMGASSQTVTVTDAPPMLDTANATLGGAIENELYSNMPLSMGGSPRNPSAFRYLRPSVQEGMGQGVYGGTGQTNLNENYVEGIPASNTRAQGDNSAVARAVSYERAAQESLGDGASGTAFDDYFEYKVAEPITIRKNESAMVPILQAKIDAERVTLWSAQHPTPLRALWVTNTSNLTLDRGSFSIVEDGNFGGEGLLDPIHPAEKRLLSYAVDQAVRVTTESQADETRVTSITAASGVLIVHNTRAAGVTYVVRNAAPEARSVVIEHPVRAGYELDDKKIDSKADPKPEESTPTLYRYKVLATAGETVRLHVGERHNGDVTYQLTNSNDSQLNLILSLANHSTATESAIQPILEARRHVADMQVEVNKVNTRLDELQRDEERQRSNVTALGNADKIARDRFVHDLNATEDEIALAKKQLSAAEASLEVAQTELTARIEAVQINEML